MLNPSDLLDQLLPTIDNLPAEVGYCFTELLQSNVELCELESSIKSKDLLLRKEIKTMLTETSTVAKEGDGGKLLDDIQPNEDLETTQTRNKALLAKEETQLEKYLSISEDFKKEKEAMKLRLAIVEKTKDVIEKTIERVKKEIERLDEVQDVNVAVVEKVVPVVEVTHLN